MSEEPVLEMKNENIPAGQDRSQESPETLSVQEKEARAESVRERTEGRYEEILSKVSTPGAAAVHTDEDALLDAKSIGATVDEESKIQKLIDLAQTKGIVHAVKVAQHLNDFYALDRMHDELADKFYDALLAKGMIKVD